MKKSERHTHLIDSLEAVMFPFQESEEEQESFTPQGRQRVDEWIETVFTTLRASLIAPMASSP